MHPLTLYDVTVLEHQRRLAERRLDAAVRHRTRTTDATTRRSRWIGPRRPGR
jgi:hypothetical protein